MREGFEQTNSALSITTPFGADKLLLDSFQGVEAISKPFQFYLTMHSADMDLAPATIVGASVTVKFAPGTGPKRYFHGIISKFMHVGGNQAFGFYTAEMVPSLWLLSLSKDRKIYQNKTSSDIIKEVLGDFAITFDAKLTGTYVAQEYCVQYDETALEFISRLMEQEGIFYFFKFADGSHTMVLGDSSSAHTDCTDATALKYFSDHEQRPTIDMVTQLSLENKLVVQNIEVSDFDYLNPNTSLLAETSGALGKGKVFSFPGKHSVKADGTQRSKVMSDAMQVQVEVYRGTSYCYPLMTGTKFTLSGHPRSSLNAAMVVRQVTHSASPGHYSNGFETFLATKVYRPPRHAPSPRVFGSHTAMVVGPSGEEIWTDKYGRIKVSFHWDRSGVKDENSSCWVRVSQSWAGVSWGAFFLPRIGQEVVVSYIDGDPDRPLVTGCVYNGVNTTPITLPGMQTQSTIKSRSSKDGTAGNEIRMEDKKDSEELYMHAQKDMKVEIENDLSTTLIKGSETHVIEKGDRTFEIKTGKETYSVKTTRDVTVEGNETHTNKADFTQKVTGNFELKVTGNLLIDVTGTITFKTADSLTAQAGAALTNKAGTALTNQAGTSLTNKAGTALTNQAGTALANKAGTTLDNEGLMVNNKASASQTVDGGGMLTLKGGLVKIN